MIVNQVSNLSPLDRFLYWIKERHNIYLRRKAGKPKPWTDDEVLQSYFFTNPYREHDKTTVWFRENIRDPLRDKPEVLMASIIFRWFNFIPTGELLYSKGLLTKWRCEIAKGLLRNRGKIFTGAYVIQSSRGRKSDVVCDRISAVWNDLKNLTSDIQDCHTMQSAHQRFLRYTGLGGTGFMAYEIVCDLRHTYLLEDARDRLMWSNPGPGAKRGLNRLLLRGLSEPVEDYPEQSQRLLRITQKKLAKMPEFEMREIEHSLCEYDKYERALTNQGRLKRKYEGVSNET